jgi:hypothetical protein
MKNARRQTMLILSLTAFMAEPVYAEEVILQNDSVGQQIMGATATLTLEKGELYEAVFDIPQEWLPIEMLGVRTAFVNGPDTTKRYRGNWQIEVWEETVTAPSSPSQNCPFASTKSPGNVIYSMNATFDDFVYFPVEGNPIEGTGGFQDLRFSSLSLPVPVFLNSPRVRVGLLALTKDTNEEFPLIPTDMDGISKPLQNFFYGDLPPFCMPPLQHYVWEDFADSFTTAQPGDWVFRLILNRLTGSSPDMGTEMDQGSNQPDTGDMGLPPSLDMPRDDGPRTDATPGGDHDHTDDGSGDGLSLTSVAPRSVPVGTGAEIVIVGSGFVAGLEVMLDATKLGVIETRAELTRAVVPPTLAAGTYDVIVTNPSGETEILTEALTLEPEASSSSDGCACKKVGNRPTHRGFGFLIFGFFLWLSRTSRGPLGQRR